MKKLIKSYLIEVYEVNNTVEINTNEVKENLSQLTATYSDVINKTKLKKLFDEREKQMSLKSSAVNKSRIYPDYDETKNKIKEK